MMLNVVRGVWLAAALAAASLGCSGESSNLAKVKGNVTLDGAPLENANVVFVPAAGEKPERFVGVSDSKGAFEVTAPPGDYKVLIAQLAGQDPSLKEAPKNPGGRETVRLKLENTLPEAYGTPDKTPFRCKVPPTEKVEFALKKSGP